MMDSLDLAVRLFVFTRTAETARVQQVFDIAESPAQPRQTIEDSLRRLEAGRILVLAPGTTTIWMAHPFSAVPTDFRVDANRRTYFGNCIWDALGIPAILGADGVVTTRCPDCSEPLVLKVQKGRLSHSEALIHFAVPAARWWDNIGFT
jgi:hypothetical protein